MPGNECGDRIHNFFGQENLSQRQHLPQVVDEAWPGVGNNFWHGSQRQITPATSNVKNHNFPQTADSEERHGSSSLHQGLNFYQPILRNEFSRNQTQVQQPTLNGYVQGHQMFHNRQNEANIMEMDTEPDGRNLTSRGFSLHESQPQLGNGLEFHTKSSGFTDYTESPVNYDFFGGQQQVGTQQPEMLQSLQRQQSGISEMQLLQQQQFMLRQMQDVQRRQQFQKEQEMRQMTSFVKQQPGVDHSSSSDLINGIPVQEDVSNYSWQPDLSSDNANWLQRNVSSATQGSSSGHMFSPGQGDMPPLVGTVPAHVDQSLYGAPVSGTGVPQNRFPMLQMDTPNLQEICGGSSSFSGNQYAAFSEQVSFQDGNTILRQGHQCKILDASPASQDLSSDFDMEHLQRVNSQQNHGFLQEFHERQDLGGMLQSSKEKAISQISPPQKVATLDPTEERILFGSDDNLWDSFGKDAGIASGGFNILDGADMSGPSPSLLSGSWSALMQSAVAETSTDNMGTREEWSGLTSMPREPTTKDQRNQISSNFDKQQLTWANHGFQTPPLNSGVAPFSGSVLSEAAMTADHCCMPAVPQEGVAPTDFSVTWSSLSAGQQHLSDHLLDGYSDVYMPDVKTMKNSETTSSHSHNEEDQTQKDGVIQLDSDTLGTQLQSIAKEQLGIRDDWTQRFQGNHFASVRTIASQGQDLAVGCSTVASISGTPIFQRESEAFDQSLKPNFSLPQSFSSIRQVQGMKKADVDPFNRTTKKFKGVDGILNIQSVASQGGQEPCAHNKMVREGLPDEKLVSSVESMTLSFASRLTDGRIANAPSADTNPLGQNDSPNLASGSNGTSVISQHSQVSQQMATSLFDRYGTLKNRQILSSYDAQNLATKTSDPPVPFGTPTGIYHTQSPVERENNLAANAKFCAAVHKNPNSTENVSSSQLLLPEVASEPLELKIPKKRKTATSDLVPWHREVTSGPQRLQTISSAEVNWSKAVNRLAEKAEEADTVDDNPPLLRLKRRLVLITQLMQLLLHPPTARALFDDAISNYETVIYLVARSTLGYACSMLGCNGISMSTPASVGERVHDEPKTLKKVKDQYFSKVREDLFDRARKLEDDLLRLDKRMSVLDLIVECQDLERFAVINRFAKFHGRGQADGAETSSSSGAPTRLQKYFPQRYVTALPMPKNLPDRVQCLSF